MNVLLNSNLYTTEDMLMIMFMYVDVLFRSPVHLEKFHNYLNSKHRNIRFACEKEHNNFMPFLDVLITRTTNAFKTSVYHKPTFSGVNSNFNSFISEEYKVDFHFIISNVFNCFRFFNISFRSIPFKRNIKKERIFYQIDR